MATAVRRSREARAVEREAMVTMDRQLGSVQGTDHRSDIEDGPLLPAGKAREEGEAEEEEEGEEEEEEEEEGDGEGEGEEGEVEAMMNGVGPSKRKRFTPRDKTQILSYLRESNNLRATARKFNVDRKTIRSWVEHQGSLPPPEVVGVAQEENPASNQLITPVDRTPPTKRRRNLTAGEKLAIVQKANAGVTVRQVAKEFGVDPKSVRYWQRQKVELEGQVSGSTQKSTHVSAIPAQFEQSLGVWLQMEETRGSNVTYAMIVDKLREMTKGSVYECFNPTDSWLLHFKKKYSIKSGNGGQTLAEQAMKTGPAPSASEPEKAAPGPLPQTTPSGKHVCVEQLGTVIVFNTVREMLGSHMPQGTVALCEGNPRLFVNTAQGWLRAEPWPGVSVQPAVSKVTIHLYKGLPESS